MMRKETYERIFQVIGSNQESVVFWNVMSRAITLCTGICYGVVILGRILLSQWRELGVLVLVPALSFLGISIFRKFCDAQRPYEVYDFKPLLPKDTKGKSFPSRHMFSIYVIAATVAHFYPEACIGLGFAGIVLGVIRVITGVHFPRDVVAGAAAGIFFGVVANILFLFI